ncbi:unnamed protein product [Boreogadus saida]
MQCNARYCKPLVVAALEGLQERFKDMMAEPYGTFERGNREARKLDSENQSLLLLPSCSRNLKQRGYLMRTY